MNIKQTQTAQQQTPGRSDLLTIVEAASMLRLQVSTLRAWVLHRQIPYVKLGGKRVFFRRDDLDTLIAQSVVPATDRDGGL